ncbi:IS4 family transposase [Candidatus Gottesmanbacteria bacterium]|nr:IS4 family transposase [Candidatus Gottesmanbacteria bacterium]
MNQGKYVFSQIMEHLPYYQFSQCVKRYRGDYRIRGLTCLEQFLAMAFGQLTYRESLRDVVICLNSQKSKLYHLGFRSSITRSTLARMNERKDWRIYRDFAKVLIGQARKLYTDDKEFDLNLRGTAYVIDSTTIELCLNIFQWARLLKVRAAVRLHLQLDLQGNIPSFFDITTGKVHDVNFLDMIIIESGAYYIMDRGYLDFERLYRIHQSGAFFVTRAKKNFAFKRLYSNKVDKNAGIRCDQIIRLTNYQVAKKYPDKLRRIKYFDQETNKFFVFLTNDFNIDAKIVADLYKYRWQIELFFKWIKQHLKIKAFWGYSENAVKTQICIALCVYLLVAIINKRLNIDRNLYEILQILSVAQLDKSPLGKLISENDLYIQEQDSQKQANLWDFK